MNDLPQRIGTIGAGNMAEAILRGLLNAGMSADQLIASDTSDERREYIEYELGIRTTAHNHEVAANAELVVLAIKPIHLAEACAGLPDRDGPLYLSIVAGCRLESLHAALGADARVARAMPNTPALIGSGITALADDGGLGDTDLALAEATLAAVGSVVRLPEQALDAVTGLSGSGPAYVYLFIEALTEAGVQEGLPADTAKRLATETIVGATAMVQVTGEDPALLRKRVTSPGGTTAAGLAALDAAGFRSAVVTAVSAASARSKELAGTS